MNVWDNKKVINSYRFRKLTCFSILIHNYPSGVLNTRSQLLRDINSHDKTRTYFAPPTHHHCPLPPRKGCWRTLPWCQFRERRIYSFFDWLLRYTDTDDWVKDNVKELESGVSSVNHNVSTPAVSIALGRGWNLDSITHDKFMVVIILR